MLSGGIDSTACLAFLLSNNFDVSCTFVDFGQPARINELAAVDQVAKFYGVPLYTIRLDHTKNISRGEIPGRNAFLIFAGLMTSHAPSSVICLGIHRGTAYVDCSKMFIAQVDTVVAELTNGTTRVLAPFIEWDKNGIVNYAKAERVPIALTYSCEVGGNTPCGECSSCHDRSELRC